MATLAPVAQALPGSPTLSPGEQALHSQFAHVMGDGVPAVGIITTDGPEGGFAVTVSTFRAVPQTLPGVLVSLNGNSPAGRAVQLNGVFVISMLEPGLAPLGALAAGAADNDAWDSPAESAHTCPIPHHKAAVTALECRVTGTHTTGLHAILIAEVIAIRQGTQPRPRTSPALARHLCVA